MSLVPPLARMSPTRKDLRHVCPSRPKILGTPLKSARLYIQGVGGKCPLPRPRAPMSPTRKCLGPLVSVNFKTPGYDTAVNSYFYIFEGEGKCPLPPPPQPAPMSPTRKYMGHVCPFRPIILGTLLKSARFHIQGVWGQVPLAPSMGAHVPHQEMTWPLVPLWFKTPDYTHCSQQQFLCLRWAQCPLSPVGTHVPHQEMPLPLVSL